VRLGKKLLCDVEIRVGDEVDIAVRDGALVMTPLNRIWGGIDLEQLVKAIPKDHKPGALDWGPPVGGEVLAPETGAPGPAARGRRWSTVCVRSIFASGGARPEDVSSGRQSDR